MSLVTNEQPRPSNMQKFKQNSDSNENNQECCCVPYTKEYDGNGSYLLHMFCKFFCCPCVHCGVFIGQCSDSCCDWCNKRCCEQKPEGANRRRSNTSDDDTPFYYEDDNNGFDTNRDISFLVSEVRTTDTETALNEISPNCMDEGRSKEHNVQSDIAKICRVDNDRYDNDFHRGREIDTSSQCHATGYHHTDLKDSGGGYHHTSGSDSGGGHHYTSEHHTSSDHHHTSAFDSGGGCDDGGGFDSGGGGGGDSGGCDSGGGGDSGGGCDD